MPSDPIRTSGNWKRPPTRRAPKITARPPTVREEIRDGLERALASARRLHREYPRALVGSLVGAGALFLGILFLSLGGEGSSSPVGFPTPSTVTGTRHRSRSRGHASLAPEVARARVQEVARAAMRQETTAATFPERWAVLQLFIEGLPREDRLGSFPPEVMVDLRLLAYRDPEAAAARLDELLTQAGRLATATGS